MEKILKYYRENLLFIFLMIVISVLFLADIGIIDTYSDDYYPPKQPDPPNFILEILIFLRNLSGLLMLRFLYNKRDNILDAFYNFYNQFDDPIDYDDILYMIEKNTITKEAGLYILNQRENYLNFLISEIYIPASIQEDFKKYSKDEFPEVIEVKYSMLKNGVLGFIFTVLGVTILKEILNTEIGSFSQIFSYAFPLLLTGFGFYKLQKVLSKKVAVEINHEGISCGEKFYKWSEIKFTYFGLGGNQRYPILRLYVMLKDSETPILLHDDLRWINYNRRQLGHIIETYHRRFS